MSTPSDRTMYDVIIPGLLTVLPVARQLVASASVPHPPGRIPAERLQELAEALRAVADEGKRLAESEPMRRYVAESFPGFDEIPCRRAGQHQLSQLHSGQDCPLEPAE